MNATIEPVTFVNTEGFQLFGIAHNPSEAARRDTAVVLLSPGVKSRVAPHRLYNKWSDALVAEGFFVLRFDFYGLGDSDGQIDEDKLQDFYGSVQVGRYVDDVGAALNWLSARYGFERFVLGGLCGGAITGVLAAQRDPRVVGILGLALPVMLQGSNIDYRRYMTKGHLDSLGRRYIRKLSSPRAWLRLVTMQTDYRLLVKSLKARFRRRHGAAEAYASAPQETNLNPLLHAAIDPVLTRGCRVSLLFGESDRLYWEFREKYFARYEAALAPHAACLEIDILPKANHVLTLQEWQQELFRHTREWLLTHFSALHLGAGHQEPSAHVA